jgi:hypothetical protein
MMRRTIDVIGSLLAKVKGVRLAGEFEDARQYPAQCYLIPDDTLSAEEARRLGVGSERDLRDWADRRREPRATRSCTRRYRR